ncbi:Sec-independent protein translocase protein TatC [uncultured archaeon]|nr:Sec-independent protein translocase protein TatC [uncultured archaeon]
MGLEDYFRIIAELRKKLLYVVVVFGAGAIFSFPFMGEIIKKIEYDMFYRLNLPPDVDASGQLAGISHNLSLISNELAANNSFIAQNLTKISVDLLNISQNLNVHKPAIVYLTPMEVLMLEFKMSLITGAIIASPLVIYYAYRGLKGRMPGIISVNKMLIISTALVSILLFSLGAAYSYFYMLPFFLSYIYQDAMSLGVNATFSIYEFIYFIVLTTVILGFAFELPLVMTLLVRFGVTSRQTLAHYRKHAYIILLIVAAWVTPDPTMFSQIMVMLPFVILYEASLLGMKMMGK